MKAVRYTPQWRDVWDEAVRASRCGTFLHERGFMDYHADRFEDASLLFLDEDAHPIALLPANVRRAEHLVVSHGGLTYGGLLLSPRATLGDARRCLATAAGIFMDEGCQRLSYRPTPHIYHAYPAEEDLYWLFRAGAKLEARQVSACLDLSDPLSEALWHRKMKKEACKGLTAGRGGEPQLRAFWEIVEDVLLTRHATHPVHTADEMWLLMQRFPENIHLHVATDEGRVVTGCLLFVTPRVAHMQYMEVGAEGRKRRALDWLVQHLIVHYREAGLRYFDFGISTEQAGSVLNEGLAYQKEGFGGRAVCYDAYDVGLYELKQLCTSPI